MKMAAMAILMAAIIIILSIVPLKIRREYKLLLWALVLIACLKQQLTRLFGGPMFFAPALPAWILLPANWLYAVTFIFFLLLLIASCGVLLLRGIFYCCQKSLPLYWHGKILKLHLLLLFIAIILASYGMYCGMKTPEVKAVELRHAALPASGENLRIAVLADLHIDNITRAERIKKIVQKTNELNADVIVLLGDMVDGTVEQRQLDVQELSKLHARYGIYGVMGNHDCYSGYTNWQEFFRSMNINMLENRHCQLPGNIYIAGIPDPAARKMANINPDLPAALRGIPSGAFILLLSHRPGTAPEAAESGVSVQLSGHTHGGMIRLFDQAVKKFNNNFVSGLYILDHLQLYVSNGSAIWNGFPIRLGRSAEITIITLKSM